jgi:hypothetical protein
VDSEAKLILQAAMEQVPSQEEEHVTWAASTWRQAVMPHAMPNQIDQLGRGGPGTTGVLDLAVTMKPDGHCLMSDGVAEG